MEREPRAADQATTDDAGPGVARPVLDLRAIGSDGRAGDVRGHLDLPNDRTNSPLAEEGPWRTSPGGLAPDADYDVCSTSDARAFAVAEADRAEQLLIAAGSDDVAAGTDDVDPSEFFCRLLPWAEEALELWLRPHLLAGVLDLPQPQRGLVFSVLGAQRSPEALGEAFGVPEWAIRYLVRQALTSVFERMEITRTPRPRWGDPEADYFAPAATDR